MKEKIENLLSKPTTKAGRLQRACLYVMRQHERDGALPTSVRFVYYELVAQGVIPKSYGTPGGRTPATDVSEALTHLRRKGVIRWEDIVDETRGLNVWRYANTVAEYVDEVVSHARIDLWEGEAPPLVLTESRSLVGVLRSIASTYLVSIASMNGQAGGFLHTDIGPLVERATRTGTPFRIFYLGDLDLSGRHIEANVQKVLDEYGPCEWQRLAITEDQRDEYSLIEVMKTDKRYNGGRAFPAVETEALSQRVIQRILVRRLDAELPRPLSEVREEEEHQRVPVRAALLDAAEGEEDVPEWARQRIAAIDADVYLTKVPEEWTDEVVLPQVEKSHWRRDRCAWCQPVIRTTTSF